ncbi:hypothetical protein HU200_048213 [Digitaria exilis]|uniref:Uncharacterized protein n=1 Tax=Digitaria exilis TaxID=1010633 RepID=A0A835AVT6_9POAL|nr:hypothetical protein HU200_048213 [Digitaria exilis]
MVISQPHYQNFRVQSGYTQRGWLGYKMDHGERTVEKPATSLKVDHVIELPCQQLNGNRRYRRRVSLPDQLVPPGGEIYYLLEYKSYPNMDYRQRALLLAQEAAEAAAAAQAVAAPQDVAALQAVAAGQGDEDQGDAAVAAGQGDEDQGDAAVAAAQGDEGQDDADHSSSDDTYVPNEDEDYDLIWIPMLRTMLGLSSTCKWLSYQGYKDTLTEVQVLRVNYSAESKKREALESHITDHITRGIAATSVCLWIWGRVIKLPYDICFGKVSGRSSEPEGRAGKWQVRSSRLLSMKEEEEKEIHRKLQNAENECNLKLNWPAERKTREKHASMLYKLVLPAYLQTSFRGKLISNPLLDPPVNCLPVHGFIVSCPSEDHEGEAGPAAKGLHLDPACGDAEAK